MGKRGPAKKPTEIKKLEGNPGHRRLNEHEVQPPGGLPEPPEGVLGEVGLREWQRIVALLAPLHLATQADYAALVMYCKAWENYVRAVRDVEREGMIKSGSKGQPMTNPRVRHQRDAFEMCWRIMGHFGMTPASRAGLADPAAKNSEEEEWAELQK